MTATAAAFERAGEMGTKIATFGILFGVLPGPTRLRLLCIASISAADNVLLSSIERALGLTPPVIAPEPLVFLLTACTVSYLSSAALHRVSQFEAAMGDLRQLVDARSPNASRSVDARVHKAWREGPLARIHLMAAQVHIAMPPLCPRHHAPAMSPPCRVHAPTLKGGTARTHPSGGRAGAPSPCSHVHTKPPPLERGAALTSHWMAAQVQHARTMPAPTSS
jgi:hypothetical protein